MNRFSHFNEDGCAVFIHENNEELPNLVLTRCEAQSMLDSGNLPQGGVIVGFPHG